MQHARLFSAPLCDRRAALRIVEAVECRVRIEAEIHLLCVQVVVAAPVFRLDGEVRRLLHLQNQAARADGVNHARGNVEYIARLHRNTVDEARHDLRVGFAPLHGGAEFLLRDRAVKAKENTRIGPCRQNQPRLSLAVGTVKILLRKRAGRVRLHRQTDRTVKIFNKNAQILTFAEVLLLVLTQQHIEGLSILQTFRDAF